MINMLRCSWIVAFCYCTLLVYFTVIVHFRSSELHTSTSRSKVQYQHAPSRLPILRSVFLPVCVFVSSVIVIFVSVKMTQRQPRCKEKRKGEEKSRKRGEKKRRGTTLTKVVSSLSLSPTHQGPQYWHRAMQPVVVGSWRGGDRGRGSQRRLRGIRGFLDFGITEGKLSKYVCSAHARHG